MVNAKQILNDPATSPWLREALRSALACDAVAVANDAELLVRVLHERVAYVAPRGAHDGERATARTTGGWIRGTDVQKT